MADFNKRHRGASQQVSRSASQRQILDCSRELRMLFLESRCVLICPGEGTQLRILIMTAEKCDADWRSRTANRIVFSRINFWRCRRVVATNTIGYDHGWMSGQVRNYQLLAVCRCDDHVYLFKELRHLANRKCACAIGLDVFNSRIKAGYAEDIWPVVFALLCQQLVATGPCQFVERSSGFGL